MEFGIFVLQQLQPYVYYQYRITYLYYTTMNISSHRALQGIVIIALLSTIWSLYYGYFWDLFWNIYTWDLFNTNNAYPPCDMCWYMRIFQYSSLIIGIIALKNKDYGVAKYLEPLSRFGLVIATWKYLLEMWLLPDGSSGLCNPNAPKSCDIAVQVLGPYVTLALLGMIAFVMTIVLSRYLRKGK